MKSSTALRPAGIDVSVQTHVGAVRPRNEDSVDLGHVPLGVAGDGVLVVVADGMGGIAGGATASALTVQIVIDSLQQLEGAFRPADAEWQRRVSGWLRETATRANQGVRQLGADEPSLAGMGSTLLLGLIVDGWLGIVWVGDSRGYLLRGETLVQLTRDHSWDVDREMEGAGADPEVQASPYRGMLTSMIGRSEQTEIGVRWERLEPADLLVFASDGLTNYYHGEALAAALTSAAAIDPSAAAIAARLIEWANAAGGADNISVGIARIGSVKSRLPAPSQVTQSLVPHRAWRVMSAVAASAVAPGGSARRVSSRVAALAGAAAITLGVGVGAGALYMKDGLTSRSGVAVAVPAGSVSMASPLAAKENNDRADSTRESVASAANDEPGQRSSGEREAPQRAAATLAPARQSSAPSSNVRVRPIAKSPDLALGDSSISATPPSSAPSSRLTSGSITDTLSASPARRADTVTPQTPPAPAVSVPPAAPAVSPKLGARKDSTVPSDARSPAIPPDRSDCGRLRKMMSWIPGVDCKENTPKRPSPPRPPRGSAPPDYFPI